MTVEYYLATAAGAVMLVIIGGIVLFALRGLFRMAPRQHFTDTPPQPICIAGSCEPEYHLTGWRPEQQAELSEPAHHPAIQVRRQAPALPARQQQVLPGANRPALGSGERQGQIVIPAKIRARR